MTIHKICVATTAHYPLDTRIYFKQIHSLSRRCIVDYYTQFCIDIIPKPSGKFIQLHKPTSKLGRVRVNYELFELLKGSDYSVYYFHDPELWLLGLFLKLKKKAVIVDLHEDFSKQILDKEWIPIILRKLLSFFFAQVEKYLPKLFDYVILAEDSYLEKFNNALNIEVIHNFPFKQKDHKTSYHFKTFKMVYVGDITKVRGIMGYLELLKLGKENGLNLELVLIGRHANKSTEKECNEYVKKNNLLDNIVYYGRLPNKEIYDILNGCDLGLALLHPITNYVLSYPTKIFEYMSIGLPILASNFKLWNALVNDNECGYTVDPFNIVEAFHIVKRYYYDLELRKTHGKNGINLINRKVNWENEAERLLKVFQNLADCKKLS